MTDCQYDTDKVKWKLDDKEKYIEQVGVLPTLFTNLAMSYSSERINYRF